METAAPATGNPAAPAPADPVLSPLLRCLDPAHEPGCTRCAPGSAVRRPLCAETADRCTAPPLSGTETDFELVGDPGLKNGALGGGPATVGG